MSITGTTIKDIFAGSGGASQQMTTSFSVNEVSEIVAYERVKATNVYTLMTQGSGADYTVVKTNQHPGPKTAKLTVETAHGVVPASTHEWIVFRRGDFLQELSFQQGGRFDSNAFAEAVDRPTMLAQELDYARTRTLHVGLNDVTDTVDDTVSCQLPEALARANKLLSFGARGEVTATTVSTISPTAVTLGTISETLLPHATDILWRGTLGVPENAANVAKFEAGTNVTFAAITATEHGTGFFYDTDNEVLYYSGGSGTVFSDTPGGTGWNIVGSQAKNPALGSATQRLKVNAGANALEFYTPTADTPSLAGVADRQKLVFADDAGTAYVKSGYKTFTFGTLSAESLGDEEAHGLGGYPRILQGWLECTSTDKNWADGDRLPLPSYGIQLYATTTVFGFRATDLADYPRVVDKTNFDIGASQHIDDTKWIVILEAWR